MKITIDSKLLDEYKITPSQFYLMLSLSEVPDKEEINSLITEQFLVSRNYTTNKLYLTQKGSKAINTILNNSVPISKEKIEKIKLLAQQLQSLFPEGKKAGTNNYWRGNLPEIIDRIQSFFKRFGEYSDEIIIQATTNYIEAFQYNTNTMRTLKYFISKKTDDGVVSDLLTYIENINSNNTEILETTKLI